MKRFALLAGGLVAGLALTALAFLWYRSTQPPELHGMLLEQTNPARDFTLTTVGGRRVSLSEFRGKVVLVYFGYTFCPDACPATLYAVKKAFQALGDQADRVQMIMISVDPGRDTPDEVNAYAQRFDKRFLGVTGPEAEVLEIAALFGVIFEKHAGSAATGYLIDHTASLMTVDAQGHLRLIFPYGVKGEDIASDVRYLLAR
ncbi:MAG: SCO family protein [Anaerolineales bacterium]|nr:SCO family protein [Anaerolineales bacterium]